MIVNLWKSPGRFRMGVVAPALSLLLLFILSPLSLQAETPSEIIDIFYTSRKFLHGTALEIIGAGSLSSAGKRAAVDILYDYTVIEVATESRARAYAEVEVRLKSLEEGLRSRREFWKMSRADGRWAIDNIYTPLDWQIKKVCRPGSSLPERVEALAAFRFEYEVEDVPPGPPMTKCFAYIGRHDFSRAWYWADVEARQKSSAEAFFYRGLLSAALGRQDAAVRDVNMAIRLDRRYYYVLMQLLEASKGGGGSGYTAEKRTRTMQGGVQSIFLK